MEMCELVWLLLFSSISFGVMPIYFWNCLAAVNCHIQMGLWKATCVSKSNSYSLHLLCAGDGRVWGLTSSFSVVVGLVSAASVCTGCLLSPFLRYGV